MIPLLPEIPAELKRIALLSYNVCTFEYNKTEDTITICADNGETEVVKSTELPALVEDNVKFNNAEYCLAIECIRRMMGRQRIIKENLVSMYDVMKESLKDGETTLP